MTNKKVLLTIFVVVGLTLSFFWLKKSSITAPEPVKQEVSQQKDISKKAPYIVSTKPEPLDDSVIAATDTIEITFNRSLENVGEFKSKIEPQVEYKVEVSGDRKTARIIPAKPYTLGTTYTLFIGTETKFDGVGRWGKEKVFHFRTIKYTGV